VTAHAAHSRPVSAAPPAARRDAAVPGDRATLPLCAARAGYRLGGRGRLCSSGLPPPARRPRRIDRRYTARGYQSGSPSEGPDRPLPARQTRQGLPVSAGTCNGPRIARADRNACRTSLDNPGVALGVHGICQLHRATVTTDSCPCIGQACYIRDPARVTGGRKARRRYMAGTWGLHEWRAGPRGHSRPVIKLRR
jgi:hypothetical protein